MMVTHWLLLAALGTAAVEAQGAPPAHVTVRGIGAGWTDDGDFPTPQSWWRYLDAMAQRSAAPTRTIIEDTRP